MDEGDGNHQATGRTRVEDARPSADRRPTSTRGTAWPASCLLATFAAMAGAALALGTMWLMNGSLRLATQADRMDLQARVDELTVCESAVTATLAAQAMDLARHEQAVRALEARIDDLTASARRSNRFLDGLRLLLLEVDASPTPTHFATSLPKITARPTAAPRRGAAMATPRPTPPPRPPRPVD